MVNHNPEADTCLVVGILATRSSVLCSLKYLLVNSRRKLNWRNSCSKFCGCLSYAESVPSRCCTVLSNIGVLNMNIASLTDFAVIPVALVGVVVGAFLYRTFLVKNPSALNSLVTKAKADIDDIESLITKKKAVLPTAVVAAVKTVEPTVAVAPVVQAPVVQAPVV